MSKEYIQIHRSTWDSVKQLSDAECGRIFKAMLEYSVTGNETELRGNERYAWPFVKAMIDASTSKQEKLAEVSRRNGAKGGRPVEPVELHQNPVGFLGFDADVKERTREERPPLVEEKKESTKESKEEYIPQKEENKKEQSCNARVRVKEPDGFDEFWKAYPRKVGKGAARNSYARAIAKGVTLETLLDALEKRKQSEQWMRDGGNFIPHPSTWLNQERWEDDLNTEGGIRDGKPVFGTGGIYQGNGREFDLVFDA